MSTLTDDYKRDRRDYYQRGKYEISKVYDSYDDDCCHFIFIVAIQIVIQAVDFEAERLPHFCWRVMLNDNEEIIGIGIGTKRGPGERNDLGRGCKVWIYYPNFYHYIRRNFGHLERLIRQIHTDAENPGVPVNPAIREVSFLV